MLRRRLDAVDRGELTAETPADGVPAVRAARTGEILIVAGAGDGSPWSP